MKLRRTAVFVLLTSGLVWGQGADMPNRVRGLLANPPSQSPAPPASQAVQMPARGTAKEYQAKSQKATLVSVRNPPTVSAPKPAGDSAADKLNYAGPKRDPFVSVVVERGPGGAPCSSGGKRCLVADEVVLRGIVRTQNGLIAVVANRADKAYFLRENDPVFNGTVIKITGDSIVFKEHSIDNLGRVSNREVVKKVAPSV